MTIASDSLTQPRNFSHHHQTKESCMKIFRNFFLFALIALSSRAFAVTDNLNVTITVTIVSTIDLEWVNGTTPMTNRKWGLTAVALDTAYTSETDGTMVESDNTAVVSRTTALDLKNNGSIPVNLTFTVTVVSGAWTQRTIGAAAALDKFSLEYSKTGNGGAWIDQLATPIVSAALAAAATQTFDLRLKTPLTVSSATAAVITATITAVNN